MCQGEAVHDRKPLNTGIKIKAISKKHGKKMSKA